MSVVIIKSIASISPLGATRSQVVSSYEQGTPLFRKINTLQGEVWGATLKEESEPLLQKYVDANPAYRHVDRSVLMGIYAAEQAWLSAGWAEGASCVVNAGSSRGATMLWEKFHAAYVHEQQVPVRTSPTTTLGNIATHIAQHLKLNAGIIEHSITCGSGLQAIANTMAWLKAGMAQRAVAVSSEASVTGFTVAQMQALGVYSEEEDAYPCKPFYEGTDKQNTMVLGEAAVGICLELKESPSPGDIYIQAMGFGNETLTSSTSIDREGAGFQQAMNMALSEAGGVQPDMVVAHAPGTVKGDQAEKTAIKQVFGDKGPIILSNKWLTGHTFGSSGTLNVEWAGLLLSGKAFADFPYTTWCNNNYSDAPKTILVNAMGFGGNAISLLLTKA